MSDSLVVPRGANREGSAGSAHRPFDIGRSLARLPRSQQPQKCPVTSLARRLQEANTDDPTSANGCSREPPSPVRSCWMGNPSLLLWSWLPCWRRLGAPETSMYESKLLQDRHVFSKLPGEAQRLGRPPALLQSPGDERLHRSPNGPGHASRTGRARPRRGVAYARYGQVRDDMNVHVDRLKAQIDALRQEAQAREAALQVSWRVTRLLRRLMSASGRRPASF